MSTHIAMWSGPRNISTAMMRSWETRGDAFVCDEPLYAHYLKATGLPHPGAAEVIEHHETDWDTVTAWLTGPVPDGRAIFYQKHMAHHLLDGRDHDWVDKLTNCFLIRDPAEMLASLSRVLPEVTLPDTGLPQQVKLFERERRRLGTPPPVIDARDVLTDPPGVIGALCAAVDVPWTDRMLAWPPGPRETDGVWAKHWYGSVEESTGFAPYTPREPDVPPELLWVLEIARELYDELHEHRISTVDA